jgi:hypothetical protein
MIKLFRVILSLDTRDFISGAAQAGQIITGFKSALDLVRMTFETLANAARGFWDTFIAGAISDQKFIATLSRIIGDGKVAADVFSEMEQKAAKFGVSSDDLAPGVVQLANALKAMDGAVDPNKLSKYTDMVIGLSRRFNVSADQAATAISRGMAGDFGLLQRLMGTSLDSMEGLSAKTKEVLGNAQQAGDEMLGTVTRVAGQEKGKAEDSLAAMDEIFEKLNISAEEGSETVDANLQKIREKFDMLKDRVGDKILPYLNEALEKFIDFFDKNEATIDRFADALGDMLGRLAEGGLDALLDQMQNFDPSQFERLIDSINSVDWKSVASALNTVAGGINTLANIGGAMGAPTGVGEAGAAANKGVNSWADKTFTAENGLKAPGGAATDKMFQDLLAKIGIHITVGVDQEGQISVKNVAQKEAAGAIDQFTNALSKGADKGRQ